MHLVSATVPRPRLCCAGVLALCAAAAPVSAPESVSDGWALRPLRRPAVPELASPWVRTPIDAFVLRRLRAAGLTPSPDADRRTLIRRLTYDLHGLPPTPAAIDAFVTDRRPDAYPRLVDRLLASPRYGERWARHWLDVVHYGETHGFDKDKLRRHAWPYRDYVIRAFNQDRPYARFVSEQVAGDVLFPDHPDGILGTGFIAAGPWDFVGHVELREGTVDKAITRSLDRDDMVANVISTFTSTTAHCARCHDHKFDPIPQRDYYRLQAVFAGVERADRPYPDPATAGRRAALTTALQAAQARRAALADAPAVGADRQLQAVREQLRAARAAVPPATVQGTTSRTLGYHSAILRRPDRTRWVQVDLGASLALDAVLLVPAHVVYGGHPGPGFGFPPRFKVELSDDPQFATGTTLADHTAADFPNPGDAPVTIPAGGQRGRYLRVTATRLWRRTGDYVFALAELVALADARNVAAGAAVQAHDSIEAPPGWSRPNLTDGHGSRTRLADAATLQRVSAHAAAIRTLTARDRGLFLAALSTAERAAWQRLATRIPDLRRQLAALPADPLVYAATHRFRPQGNFRPATGPRRIRVLKRGNVRQPGTEVAAGALSMVPGLDRHFAGQTPTTPEGDRRAALARWLVDPHNPLTWRSIVNRVWQYHFGQGLVRTPNDFGRMGDRPSHPELLDWLAVGFRDDGGSFKRLHRRILLSSVYRQGSGHRPAAAAQDGDNRLLWRMHRRRLEAECVRDGVLAVAGRLDLTMGGPPAMQFGFKDDHSPHYDYAAFDVDSPAGRRRSIYRWIVRSVADPFLERLDCPDASLAAPVRFTTITANQALALLNNRFMVRHAEHFADRLEREATTAADRVVRAFRLALGRVPTAAETATFQDLATRHGLPALCRTLLNSNEFLFID